MTVGELIKELDKYDKDMLVLTEDDTNHYAPLPRIEIRTFKLHYWDGGIVKYVPENQEFLVV